MNTMLLPLMSDQALLVLVDAILGSDCIDDTSLQLQEASARLDVLTVSRASVRVNVSETHFDVCNIACMLQRRFMC